MFPLNDALSAALLTAPPDSRLPQTDLKRRKNMGKDSRNEDLMTFVSYG
jgi:hypothetical protein